MKTNLTTMLTCCLAVGGTMLTGCTDSNYDLGNLDKKIAIGSEQEFILPGNNSTHDIALGDVIDLPADGAIQTDDNGDYFFMRSSEDDDLNAADVVVDEISLNKDDGGENVTEIDISDFITEDAARALSPRRAMSNNTKEIYSFTFDTDNTPNVLGLSMAKLRAGLHIQLTFTDELKAKVDNIRQISIGLPAFFDLDVESEYGDIVQDKTNMHNILTFKNIKQNGISMKLHLNQLIFSSKDSIAYDDFGYYLYADKDEVKLKGGVMIDVDYRDETAAARGNRAVLQENLKIICESEIEDITLTGADGYFNPQIELDNGIGQFSVGDLPDFLDDPEVSLVVSDPEIRLFIDSDIDLRGIIHDAHITSYDEDGKQLADVAIEPFIIQPHNNAATHSTKTQIIISDTKSGEGYVNPVDGQKLADLLKKLPNSVSFDCIASADSTYLGSIDMGRHYTIKPSYEIYSPLSFNVGTQVVYRDTINGWHDSLDDIKLSKGATVTLTAEVLNCLPVELEFTAKGIDVQGRAINENLIDIQVSNENGSTPCRIPAGSEANPGTQRIKIVMTQKDDKSFCELIDGISMRASAKTTEGFSNMPLNMSSQKLKVQNIGITLKGHVIVDLDD